MDKNARNIFLKQSFEPEFIAVAKPFLARGGIMFDIGANFGFCSFGLLGALPQTDLELHLFEACPALCELLRQSAALHPRRRMVVNCGCVTDHAGTSHFESQEENRGDGHVTAGGLAEVKNLVLDDYLRAHHIPKVAFTKIDVEGHEVCVLRGARDALTEGRLEAIYFEVANDTWSRQGFTFQDGFALLRHRGYQLFFCKSQDLAGHPKGYVLKINGFDLPVAEVGSTPFPDNYRSDLLAIHSSAACLGH